MHTLTEALDSWDVIEDIKSIETASIPVIKAKIDLFRIRNLIKKEKKEKAAADGEPEEAEKTT